MDNNKIHILLIEDNPGDARLIKELLKEDKLKSFDITWIDRLSKIDTELINVPFDIVLTDLTLPDSIGLETFYCLKKLMPEVPFIILTGATDETLGEQAIKKGADDFLEKGNFKSKGLITAIKYAVERNNYRNNLEKSERRFKTLIEKNSDGIIVVNKEGIIRYLNPAAENLFGREKEELLGELFGFPVTGENSTELTILTSRQKLITVGMRVVETEWEGEQVAICTLRDISLRKIAEKELIEKTKQLEKTNLEIAELNTTKNRLFSIIAHDLKNNFNPLIGISAILMDNSESYSKEEYQDMARMLNEAFNNQYQLLENLLEWGQIQRGQVNYSPGNIQLRVIIQNNLTLLKHNFQKKEIITDCKIDPELFISADKNMLDTIIRNLLDNAVKFSYPKGKIQITTELTNSVVQVNIRDFGMGIDHENINKLFNNSEIFSSMGTDNEQGSGLGLNLCRTFIEKHNGKIWVKSKKGEGTIFSFTLPRYL